VDVDAPIDLDKEGKFQDCLKGVPSNFFRVSPNVSLVSLNT
jgi:hypothetical protein